MSCRFKNSVFQVQDKNLTFKKQDTVELRVTYIVQTWANRTQSETELLKRVRKMTLIKVDQIQYQSDEEKSMAKPRRSRKYVQVIQINTSLI